MRKIVVLSALAALAACSQAETTPEAEPTTETVVTEAAVASWPIEAGVYEYTRSDGVKGVNTVAADGTFSNAIEGGQVETGTWAQENGLSCLTPAEGDKRCYTFTEPDAAGNFSGTTQTGVTATIHRAS